MRLPQKAESSLNKLRFVSFVSDKALPGVIASDS